MEVFFRFGIVCTQGEKMDFFWYNDLVDVIRVKVLHWKFVNIHKLVFSFYANHAFECTGMYEISGIQVRKSFFLFNQNLILQRDCRAEISKLIC